MNDYDRDNLDSEGITIIHKPSDALNQKHEPFTVKELIEKADRLMKKEVDDACECIVPQLTQALYEAVEVLELYKDLTEIKFFKNDCDDEGINPAQQFLSKDLKDD